MRAIGWTLASVVALTGACKSADEPCIEVRGTLETESYICTVAPGGWLLSTADDELIIEKLVDTELVELARIPSNGSCGTLAEHPETREIWVIARTDAMEPAPDRFYKLDASGAVLLEGELSEPDAMSSTRQIAALDDGLIRTAEISLVNPDMSTNWALALERYDGAGALLWSRIVDYPELGDYAQSSAGSLHISDDAIAFIVYKGWTDSATVNLISVDPADGELRWHRLLTTDDYGGPYFALASDHDGKLFLSEQRNAIYEIDPDTFEQLGLASPAQTILTVIGADGEMLASTTAEWPDRELLQPSPLAYRDGALVQVVLGYDPGIGAEPAIAVRYDDDGQLLCQHSLEIYPTPGYYNGLVEAGREQMLFTSDTDEALRLFVLGVL